MTLLVTGFGPFPGVDRNPSGWIAHQLAESGPDDVVGEVLPTEFEGSFARLSKLVERHRPRAILLLGVNEASVSLSLERFALNWSETGRPDASGAERGGPLVHDAPLARESSLPLDSIAEALEAAQVPFERSAHAGTYVCNCLFYRALCLHAEQGRDVPTGFVHVPMAQEFGPAPTGAPRLAELARWVRVVVDRLRSA